MSGDRVVTVADLQPGGSRRYVTAERRSLAESAEASDGEMPYPRREFFVLRYGHNVATAIHEAGLPLRPTIP